MASRPGRPKGVKRDGLYGCGVQTEVMRVPSGSKDLVQRLLIDLPELVEHWEASASTTRDWTQANRLLAELKSLLQG